MFLGVVQDLPTFEQVNYSSAPPEFSQYSGDSELPENMINQTLASQNNGGDPNQFNSAQQSYQPPIPVNQGQQQQQLIPGQTQGYQQVPTQPQAVPTQPQSGYPQNVQGYPQQQQGYPENPGRFDQQQQGYNPNTNDQGFSSA